MSGRIDAILRKERIREKRRKENEAKLKRQQEEADRRPKETSWRDILEKKEPTRDSYLSPSFDDESTLQKEANQPKSPIQDLLRSPSRMKRTAAFTSIDSKWINDSSKKGLEDHSAKRPSLSSQIRDEEQSSQKPIPTKAPLSKKQEKASIKESSDDDSDIDLVAHFRKIHGLDKKPEKSPESSNSAKEHRCQDSRNNASSSEDESDERHRQRSRQHKSGRNYSQRSKNSHLSSEDESDEQHRQRSHQGKSRRQKSSRKHCRGNRDDSSSEDEHEPHSQRLQRRKASWPNSTRKHGQGSVYSDSSSSDGEEEERGHTSRNHSRKRRKNSHENNKSLMDSSSDEDKPSSQKPSAHYSNDDGKPVSNPYTLELQQRNAMAIKSQNPPTKNADMNDNLWSDDGDDFPNNNDEQQKSKKRRRSKTIKSTRDSGALYESLEMALPSTRTSNNYWYLSDRQKRDKMIRLLKSEDEGALQGILHPKIEQPFFGPYENKPLDLEKGTKSEAFVPASLSRYLAPYQKEGVRFMYKCLAEKRGSIMGDEMGLGKTAQVIGLLCALFEKTGTGMDFLRITRRENVIMQQKDQAQREKDKALMEGKAYKPKKVVPKLLDLPYWYPVLIIVPPSVVDNWKNEFEKFSNFAVAIFSGDVASREKALEKLQDGRAEVLVAAKSLFQEKTRFKQLNEVAWKLVVIDEFHTFKNEKGNLSKHLRELKAEHRSLVLGMTGTLMQNDHQELWNLIDLVESGHLGTYKQFKSNEAKAIKLGRQKGANAQTIERGHAKAMALKRQLGKLLIERKKEDVLENKLTKKRVNIVLCPLSEMQKKVYSRILTLPDVQLVKFGNIACQCGINDAFYRRLSKQRTTAARVSFMRENKRLVTPRKKCCYRVPINPLKDEDDQPLIDPDAVLWRHIDGHDDSDDGCKRCPYCVLFAVLAKLNKLCSHLGSLQVTRPVGVMNRGSEEHIRFLKDLEFAKVALPPDVVDKLPGGLIRQDAVMNEHFQLSGKLKKLHHLLQRYRKEGCKVLVFSYSTQTLDFIEEYVRSQNHSSLRIDGQVAPKLRQDLCNRFNNEKDVFLFLLSTKACGLGLNLTAASKVVIFDVEWNPSWDEQAQDRAYRIGQQNDVEVVRLMAEGTVDELKYLRQLYKVQLKDETLGTKTKTARYFRGVQGDKDRKGELFGVENLLKFKADGSFLSDVWKSRKNKGQRNKSKEIEIHSVVDINLDDDDCKELFEQDDDPEALALIESHCKTMLALPSNKQQDSWVGEDVHESRNNRALTHEDVEMGGSIRNPHAARRTSENEDEHQQNASANEDEHQQNSRHDGDKVRAEAPSRRGVEPRRVEESDGVDVEEDDIVGNAVNQDELYDEEQGGAALEEGDDGYEEEMGAETQNAYASYATMQFPENPQDATSYEDDDDDDQQSYRAPRILRMQEGVHQWQAADPPPQPPAVPRMQAVVPRREADIPPPQVPAMPRRQASVPQRQVVMPPIQAAVSQRQAAVSRRGEERYEEDRIDAYQVPVYRASKRPESTSPDTFKSTFFNSRGARDSNDIKKAGSPSKCNAGESPPKGGAKKPKKKPIINLFGKPTSVETSKSKGSGGLQIPTYKRRKKK